MKSNVLFYKSEEIVFNVLLSKTKFSFDAEVSFLAGVNLSQKKIKNLVQFFVLGF